MQKPFLNVAASLLLVAPVFLAQAPAGATQAPAGPDAEATNLVTSACASCHSLDRVKNKVADKDAWTATVTRMMGKGGASLTDQQVPVVIEYLTRAAGTLTVPAPAAGGRGGGGRGGGRVAPFSAGGAAVVSAANLKVLTAENVEI